jgi:hypothetical protein
MPITFFDDAAHLVSISEGAQDIDQASMCKESFKLIDALNAEGVQASPNIQTYCRVKLAALRLQRNKDFQFIVKSDSQGGQQNDPVVSVSALSIESAVPPLLAASATNSLIEHDGQISPSGLINLVGHIRCISHIDLIGLSGINSIVGHISLVEFSLNGLIGIGIIFVGLGLVNIICLSKLFKLIDAFNHQQFIVAYVNTNSKISVIFGEDCRTFCEEEWEQHQ